MSENRHARFAPSAAARWLRCPGSVQLIENLVAQGKIEPGGGTSPAAERGTRAHYFLAESLSMGLPPSGRPNDAKAFELDDEDVAACQVAYDYVQERIEKLTRGPLRPKMYLESELQIGRYLGQSDDDCWGKADIILVGADTMEVIDYKHGSGVPVTVEDPDYRWNPQLYLYAIGAGALVQWAQPPRAYRLTIIQPRLNSGSQCIWWEGRPDELYHLLETYENAITRAKQPDAPLVPGEKQCRWCPTGKALCPALASKVLETAMPQMFEDEPGSLGAMQNLSPAGFDQAMEETMSKALETFTPEDLAKILDNASLLRSWLKAVEDYATDAVRAGRFSVPGWKLVQSTKHRKWDLDDEQLLELFRKKRTSDKKALDPEVYRTVTPVSPAQAEKRVKPLLGDRAWAGIAEHMILPKGPPVLVPESDTRPAIESVREAFEQMSTDDDNDWL